MINVNDKSASKGIFDSSTSVAPIDKKDPFKSIFSLKIDNNDQILTKKSIQIDNNFKSDLIDIPISIFGSSRKAASNDRHDLLEEAEIAKKEEDEDISSAQALMGNVENYFLSNSSLSAKTFSINKGQLFSAVKGFHKLTETEYMPLTRPKLETREREKESNSTERRAVVLQFKDARVVFVARKSLSYSSQEIYHVQDASTSRCDSSINREDQNKVSSPVSGDKLKNAGASMDSSSTSTSGDKNKDGGNAVTAEGQVAKTKEESSSKEQLVQLVKNNSVQAANAMSEDKNLKLEYKPFSESMKNELANKVIKSNQESVSAIMENEEILFDGVEKIVPSGNLRDLINNQKNVIQVDSKLMLTEILNDDGINLIEYKMMPLKDVNASEEFGKIILENKDISGLNNKSASAFGKVLQNTPSASVLERINQVAMVEKISKRIQLRQLKEFGIVNIQLDPPELGRLLVKLTIKGKEIKVSILAESSCAHEMLKNHKQVFIQSMKENGLEISEFNVNTNGNSNQDTSSQMKENQDHLRNKNSVSSVTVNNKEINHKNLQVNSDSKNLAEGYHISLIA